MSHDHNYWRHVDGTLRCACGAVRPDVERISTPDSEAVEASEGDN